MVTETLIVKTTSKGPREYVPTTVTETETETVKKTVVKTVEAEVVLPEAPIGPFTDGTYLIGTEIATGNYKCSVNSDSVRYIIKDQTGEATQIDFTSIASVPASGYVVQFEECSGEWTFVG